MTAVVYYFAYWFSSPNWITNIKGRAPELAPLSYRLCSSVRVYTAQWFAHYRLCKATIPNRHRPNINTFSTTEWVAAIPASKCTWLKLTTTRVKIHRIVNHVMMHKQVTLSVSLYLIQQARPIRPICLSGDSSSRPYSPEWLWAWCSNKQTGETVEDLPRN